MFRPAAKVPWPRLRRLHSVIGFASPAQSRYETRPQKNRPSRDDRFYRLHPSAKADGALAERQTAARRVMGSGRRSADCVRFCAPVHRLAG
ncbi:hypothetical protein C8F00_1318 [Xanthomonas vasicola]